MERLRKVFALCMLLVFLIGCNGVFFNFHYCQHCQVTTLYLFEHPDCCDASAAEHHPSACNDCGGSHHNVDTPDNVSHAFNKDEKCNGQCCISSWYYYKVNNFYANERSQTDLSDIAMAPCALLEINPTSYTAPQPIIIHPSIIPPLLQGGTRYLVSIQQLIFYA